MRSSGWLRFTYAGRRVESNGIANPDGDALRRDLGEIAVAGFLGNGEIGPIAGTPYLHGYTSAFGFFRPRA